MNPVLLVIGIIFVGAGLILEQINKKEKAKETPPVEETDAEKTARLAAETEHAEANNNGDHHGSNNGADSGDSPKTESSTDQSKTSIGLDS